MINQPQMTINRVSKQNVNETNNSLKYFTFMFEISSLCESKHNDLIHNDDNVESHSAYYNMSPLCIQSIDHDCLICFQNKSFVL